MPGPIGETFATPDDFGDVRSSDLHASLSERLGAQAADALDPQSGFSAMQIFRRTRAALAGGDIAPPGPYLLDQAVPNDIELQDQIRAAQKAAIPDTSIEDAKARVKQEGLEHHLKLPDQPSIKSPVLDLMVQEAHERRDRELAIARGPQGFLPDALGFVTGIGAGTIDPVNMAAFSIPVVGEARFGRMLASAGESLAARAAVRAGVGAAQGAVGTAILQPADWWLHTQDGLDYTMSDALRSVIMGAGMGAAFHAGGGAIGDVLARRAGRPLPGSPEDLLARALATPGRPAGEPGAAALSSAPPDLANAGAPGEEIPGVAPLTRQAAQPIFEALRDQMIAAGRPEDEANQVAAVIAARYATRAQRLGRPDAEALAREAGIDIRPGGDLAEEGRAYAQNRRTAPPGPDLFTQREAEGQTNLPGTERISDAELARRRGAEPMRPGVAQKPMDIGLFGDEAKQKSFFQRGTAPTFYSAVERAVTGAKQEKASPDQWLGMLRNAAGVKPEEIGWLGLEDWLKDQPGPVTKQAIADFVRANRIEVKEVEKGDTPHARALTEFQGRAIDQYGGLTAFWEKAPRSEVAEWERLTEAANAEGAPGHGETKFAQYTLPGGENYRELLLTLPPSEEVAARRAAGIFRTDDKELEYRSSHWDEPNVLAHVRMNDRTIDGKKTLLVEEVQSDWHQKGREYGYRDDQPLTTRPAATDEFGTGVHEAVDHAGRVVGRGFSPEEALQAAKGMPSVPDAPFKTTWPELAMKRMIRYAAENGYEKIAWVPGEAQAARYDLSKQIDHITLHHAEGETGGTLQAFDKNGHQVISKNVDHAENELPDIIGKEAAEKLLNQPSKDVPGSYDKVKRLDNADLKVGGEGMKGFYDQILPATVNKLVKKFGGKIGKGEVSTPGGIGQWSYDGPEMSAGEIRAVITDRQASAAIEDQLHEIADKVQQGFPMARAVEESGSYAAAKLLGGELSATAKAEPVHTLDVTPELRKAATEQGFPLFQKGAEGEPQGRVTFAGSKRIVELFKSANASTAMHELGHVWFEELVADAGRADAPQALKDDLATVLKWLGVDRPEDIGTPHHEQFARGFEQYLLEGKAPSSTLAAVFEKFKQWLTAIYRSLTELGTPISDEMRGVFDRMLATDEEIAAARHPAAVLADLPPRVREDALRATVADLTAGNTARTGEMLQEAAKEDPRIAESVADRSGNTTVKNFGAFAPALRTGVPHVDVILADPAVASAIANPKIDRTKDVPYSAGPDKTGPGLNIDRHFPESFTVDGKTFDPAQPFAVHEFSEREAMNRLIAGGMDEATAYKVAHWEVAEPAEGAWYRANGIDQAKAEAAYQPYIDKIQHEALAKGDGDVPPNLFKKPYPHDSVDAATREKAPVPKPTAEEIARGRGILAQGEAASAKSPVIHVRAKAARGPRARPEETWSLNEFIASKGGIDPSDPMIADVRGSIGRPNKFVPGFGNLVAAPGKGVGLDRLREAAVEAGYIHDEGNVTGGLATSTVNTLLDAIDSELRGKRVYRQGIAAPERAVDPAQRDHELNAYLDQELHTAGIDPATVTGKYRDRVLEIMDRERQHPHDALERAAMEDTASGAEAGQVKPKPEAIPGWDIPDDAGAAPGAGGQVAGGRDAAGQPAGGPARDRGQGGRSQGKADWQSLADARRPDDEDLAVASRQADKTPEPESVDPEKSPSAAEAAAREADALLVELLPRLTEEERRTFEDALNQLDRDKAVQEQIVSDGAACLAAAVA